MKILTILLTFTIILSFIVACQNQAAMSELEGFRAQRAIEEQNKAVVLKWLNEVNRENFEQLFDELWTKECQQYLNSNPKPYEYDQFRQMIKNLYLEFPVITHEVQNIYARGDKVIALFSARVKHDVDSFGVPATGREIKWKAIAVFQVSEGKIKTRWEVSDLLGMYEQLGMKLQMKDVKK
ncbi:MAG: hypothetical protein EH225_10345 [Calditrichaeota bacterium]|nr:ester cyclase [Calditrichota bacterium]RQW00521.1 MAG: hypothetical protein EH225_10345 [Calditrichota bacterium]